MNSLAVYLCMVLLSVVVQGYNVLFPNGTMSAADKVFAVEGGFAVLPCTFTHNCINQTITGSVMWYRRKFWDQNLVFDCTFHGPSLSWCDKEAQEAGGGRFRFVGDLSQRDASIMVEDLRQEDNAKYRCGLELNVGKFQSELITHLFVRAPDHRVSVVTGAEGASATLPCIFSQTPFYTVHMVTWMTKDPYRHVVTFRHQSNGLWAVERGATRYELIGDPKQGNASTQINQLSVQDSHIYLCLVEFHMPIYLQKKQPFSQISQRDVRLQVLSVTVLLPVVILCIPLGLKAFGLFVMCIVFFSNRKRRGRSIAGGGGEQISNNSVYPPHPKTTRPSEQHF
ncbi:junctional adhesion molecule-like isoform X2 [Narcine bancroftii]|uniref:junctional adhesion molecule-like isoform X2 n=1 Tax=Narcine bancroftii TaxID=1343680 RepID=UPI003831B2B1